MNDARARAQILSYLATPKGMAASAAFIKNGTGLSDAALNSALAALQYDGLITAKIEEWRDNREPLRRLYAITEAGRQQVGAMQPVQPQASAGSGNWFWQKFVAPFFGG